MLAFYVLFCADRFHAALIQIQNVLIEVLAKQHLEKDKVAQKFRLVQDSSALTILS